MANSNRNQEKNTNTELLSRGRSPEALLNEIERLNDQFLTVEEQRKIEAGNLLAKIEEMNKQFSAIEETIKNFKNTPIPQEVSIAFKDASFLTLKGDPGRDGQSIVGPGGPPGEDGKDSNVPGPRGKRGEAGKDGKDGKDAESMPGKDGSPDTPEEVRDKLSSLKGNDRLDASAIKNLPGVPLYSRGRGGRMGRGTGSPVQYADLTTQCDGLTKTFTIPTNSRVIAVFSTQFPHTYRPVVDWTGSGTTTLTLTSEVGAPETGATLFILYVE